MNEYSKRQFILMEKLLDEYQKKPDRINELASGLSSLVQYLEFDDPIWKNNFISQINVLDDLIHFTLEENFQFSQEQIKDINDAEKKMKILLDEKKLLVFRDVTLFKKILEELKFSFKPEVYKLINDLIDYDELKIGFTEIIKIIYNNEIIISRKLYSDITELSKLLESDTSEISKINHLIQI